MLACGVRYRRLLLVHVTCRRGIVCIGGHDELISLIMLPLLLAVREVQLVRVHVACALTHPLLRGMLSGVREPDLVLLAAFVVRMRQLVGMHEPSAFTHGISRHRSARILEPHLVLFVTLLVRRWQLIRMHKARTCATYFFSSMAAGVFEPHVMLPFLLLPLLPL